MLGVSLWARWDATLVVIMKTFDISYPNTYRTNVKIIIIQIFKKIFCPIFLTDLWTVIKKLFFFFNKTFTKKFFIDENCDIYKIHTSSFGKVSSIPLLYQIQKNPSLASFQSRQASCLLTVTLKKKHFHYYIPKTCLKIPMWMIVTLNILWIEFTETNEWRFDLLLQILILQWLSTWFDPDTWPETSPIHFGQLAPK